MKTDNDPRTAFRCPAADRACFHRMSQHLTTEIPFRHGAAWQGSGAGPPGGPDPLQDRSQDHSYSTWRIRP